MKCSSTTGRPDLCMQFRQFPGIGRPVNENPAQPVLKEERNMEKKNSTNSMMKKFGVLAALAVAAFAQNVMADEATFAISPEQSLQLLGPQDLINWKVGDRADYKLSASGMNLGTMVKTVAKEEGAAIWLHQEINAMGQKQTVDVLMNRADAKIVKYIVNGKEEQVPNDKIEIISQDYAEVTVPAGTFKAVHVLAKSEKIKKLEVWANPRDTVMEGTLKQYVEGGMLPITAELTSFKRIP